MDMESSQAIHINPISNLAAQITVPGSKSYSQRALVAASLAHGPSILRNVLLSEDTSRFIEALRALGANITADADNMVVEGVNGKLSTPKKPLYLGNNGTAMRFLASIVCLSRGAVTLTGDDRLCERPIEPLMAYLGHLGVRYRYVIKNGFPPVEIQADGLRGGYLKIQD
nr:hypothetical protein [Syntrophales bacterium]